MLDDTTAHRDTDCVTLPDAIWGKQHGEFGKGEKSNVHAELAAGKITTEA
jgi:hypothetical protein